jgi:phosphoribosylaminoimidazole-succinocarboxamide synthase
VATPRPLIETALEGLTLSARGKVRDVYDLGDHLLIVATDRISAFDYVLGSGIPDKGKVLTQISAFWFDLTREVVPNHLVSIDSRDFPAPVRRHAAVLAGRTMFVRKAATVPIECVVRGYLAGSGWQEYRRTGQVCGIELARGLRESDRLPRPIFTPATKAATGHDENISLEEAGHVVGAELMTQLRDISVRLYERGAAHAEARGIIVADTKFEFGLVDGDPGRILLIDEMLTPDSSRFWPIDRYEPGHGQPSFDKQFVRDYLEQIKWNKQPPVPSLPDDVIERTRAKYLEAFRRLTGRELR